MGYLCEGELWIDCDSWTEFLLRFVPGGAQTEACIEFGPPRKDSSGDLVVPFAMNTEFAPSEQATPPRFVARKPATRAAMAGKPDTSREAVEQMIAAIEPPTASGESRPTPTWDDRLQCAAMLRSLLEERESLARQLAEHTGEPATA